MEPTNFGTLAELLHETAQARQRGADPQAADAAAHRYMADVKSITDTRA